MKVTFLIFLLFVSTSNSSIYSNLKNNVLSFLTKRSSALDNDEYKRQTEYNDEKIAKAKAEIVNRVKVHKEVRNHDVPIGTKVDDFKERYYKDPILNSVARRFRKRKDNDNSTSSESSSLELQDWKDEWKEHLLVKKYEALNSTVVPGDAVNMVGARPWGVPCGDPNQHDIPWGTCMLPMECDAEYRIYRGDYFCGRTQFVCCALQLTSYDMYQGFDASFADSSLATDSYEKKTRGRDSREMKRRKKRRDKKRRRNERLKRKRKMKRDIARIVREIKKIINKSYKNGTRERKRKTKRLKKFIKYLKKKYKKDRKAVQDVHHLDLLKTDVALQKRLKDIGNVNKDFIHNSTFRDIVVNGTVNEKAAMLLLKTYPDLEKYLKAKRRSGGGKVSRDYDYDVEYGLLYH